MKIYRGRWWQDPDRVTGLLAFCALGVCWSVTVLIVVLAISRGCQTAPTPQREQVLPSPWDMEEELRGGSPEPRA